MIHIEGKSYLQMNLIFPYVYQNKKKNLLMIITLLR